MSRIGRLLDDALEDLHRVELVLADRLATMRECSTAWPPGGGGGRAGLRHWCWRHESDVAECQREGQDCEGEPMAVAGDRTGEAAVNGDRAYQDHRLVERKVKSIRRAADELVGLLARYDHGRAPTAEERRATLADLERNESAEECWSCARVTGAGGSPLFSPAARRVTLGDGELRLLCWWCLDWLRKGDGSLPTVAQVDQHRRGIPVRRPKAAS